MSFPTKITIYECHKCSGVSSDSYIAQNCCEVDSHDGYKCSDCGDLFDDLADASECCVTKYTK